MGSDCSIERSACREMLKDCAIKRGWNCIFLNKNEVFV